MASSGKTVSFHVKSRVYNPTYLKFGFIESRVDVSKPECVICVEILSNDAMKPSKLNVIKKQNTQVH